MYYTALIIAPLPSVLSNLAAVMLQQGMYVGVALQSSDSPFAYLF